MVTGGPVRLGIARPSLKRKPGLAWMSFPASRVTCLAVITRPEGCTQNPVPTTAPGSGARTPPDRLESGQWPDESPRLSRTSALVPLASPSDRIQSCGGTEHLICSGLAPAETASDRAQNDGVALVADIDGTRRTSAQKLSSSVPYLRCSRVPNRRLSGAYSRLYDAR